MSISRIAGQRVECRNVSMERPKNVEKPWPGRTDPSAGGIRPQDGYAARLVLHWCNENLLDTDGMNATREVLAVDTVAVTDQITGDRVPRSIGTSHHS